MKKNVFHFILKALFVFRYLNFCPHFFGHVGKRPDKKTKVNNVIDWKTNN